MGSNSFDSFSSRIKDLYIELEDYSFFHTPSAIGESDRKFIGRRDIIERLKCLLSNGESKSGAYLVTGYRGMGKSSFVGKTLDQICFGEPRRNFWQFFAIYFLVTLITLFFFEPHWAFFLVVGILTLALTLVIYFNVDWLSQFRKNGKRLVKLTTFLNQIILTKFSLEPRKRFVRYLAVVLLYFILILLGYLGKWVLLLSDIHSTFFANILSYTVCAFFYALIRLSDLLIQSKISLYYISGVETKKKINSWWVVIRQQFSRIANYMNYSRRNYIKINLGFDELREIDILKLISKRLQEKYRSYIFLSSKNWHWKLLKFLILFALFYGGYVKTGANLSYQRFISSTSICYYIPSQTGIPSQKFLYWNVTQYDVEQEKSTNDVLHEWAKTDFKEFSKKLVGNRIPIDSFSTFELGLANVVSSVDFLFSYIYAFIYKELYFSDTFCLPNMLDYCFVGGFLFFWVSMNRLSSSRFSRFSNHEKLYAEIKELNELIDSQITAETQYGFANQRTGFSGWHRKTKSYPIADVREIESRLIGLFEKMDQIPLFLIRPEFIFIFDEVDKIEPSTGSMTGDKGDNGEPRHENFFSQEGTRQRQQAILKLLANLKYFLSATKAKFIFIAGREMFDAALADVSDRNYFIGSIFHEVIYVNSFLTEQSDSGERVPDVTKATEKYLCKLIIPQGYINELLQEQIGGTEDCLYSLRTYNSYLHEKYNTDCDQNISKMQIQKTIITLQHFIIYLTHRTNGAPKKISGIIEGFIRSITPHQLESPKNQVIGHNPKRLYLVFTEYNQYEFGFVSFLINPIIMQINHMVKHYGDKLLVSSSFLIDHLFKFHRFGFSWRSLETVPEMIDINKTPELREFIYGIIRFLNQAHIHEIFSGLYNYRFPKRISDEISFLSKISEKESAAFNFTLDESLTIKRHYYNLLRQLESGEPRVNRPDGTLEYNHAVGAIQMLLGDLHFNDEEYNDALLMYLKCVQSLRTQSFKDMSLSKIVILTRNLLKLGFTFEKRKTNESAMTTYTELVELLSQVRDIDLLELGMKQVLPNTDFLYHYRHTPPRLINVNDFCDVLAENIEPRHEAVISKLMAFANIRLLYQPLFARFQMVEKMSMGGISLQDVFRLEKELTYFTKLMNPGEKVLCESENWKKMADILYYKNSKMANNSVTNSLHATKELQGNEPICFFNISMLAISKSTPCFACSIYNRSITQLIKLFLGKQVNTNNRIEYKELVNTTIEMIRAGNFVTQGHHPIKLIAEMYSVLGDVFLSCSTSIDFFNSIGRRAIIGALLQKFELFIQEPKNDNFAYLQCLLRIGRVGKLEMVILMYLFSGYFYKKANEHKLYSFSIVKIMHVFNDYITVFENSPLQELTNFKENCSKNIEFIEQKLVKKGIKAIYGAYEGVHLGEVSKFRNIYKLNSDNTSGIPIPLNNISVSTDLDELLYLYYRLHLRLNTRSQIIHPSTKAKLIDLRNMFLVKEFSQNRISPVDVNSGMYNRVVKLRYKVLLNYTMFSAMIPVENNTFRSRYTFAENFFNLLQMFGDVPPPLPLLKFNVNIIREHVINHTTDHINSFMDFFEHLIVDSIYCLTEILNIQSIYGTSFTLPHNFAANNQHKLAVWVDYFRNYRILWDILNDDNIGLPWAFDNEKFVERTRTRKYFSQKSNNSNDNELARALFEKIRATPNIHSLIHLRKEYLKQKGIKQKSIYDKLIAFIGETGYTNISATYHVQKSINGYYSAIETHNRGKAYLNMLDDMYFFNEDYSDPYNHFFAATERYRINTGYIEAELNKLKKYIQPAQTYDVGSYNAQGG